MGPETLRDLSIHDTEAAQTFLKQEGTWVLVRQEELDSHADAWEADRRRLAEAEKVRDDFSYISGWTINTADVPTPYLLWQALRAALSAP